MEPNKKFLTQRALNFWLLGLSYSVLYFCRFNLSSAHAVLSKFFTGWDYTTYGTIIGTALFIYGLTGFFSGPICDRFGGKKAILIGMFGSFICNLLFGATYLLVNNGYSTPTLAYGLAFSDLLSIMTLIWSTNYFFQSFGSLSVVKINSAWYTKQERGLFAGKFGTLIQLGRILVLIACPWLIYKLPWPFAFFVPAFFLLIMMFAVWQLVENKPEDIGLTYGEETKKLSFIEGYKSILKSSLLPIIIGAICVALFNGMIRNGIEHYLSRFFVDQFGLKKTELALFFPYVLYGLLTPGFMMLSSIISGPSSDRFFQSRRFPIIMGSFFLVIIGLVCLMFDMKNPYFSTAFLIFTMFSLQAVNNILMGTLTADLAGKELSGTVAGTFDGVQYMGGSVAGFGIGYVLNRTNDWHYWPAVLLIPAILAFLLSAVLTRKEKNDYELSKSI